MRDRITPGLVLVVILSIPFMIIGYAAGVVVVGLRVGYRYVEWVME